MKFKTMQRMERTLNGRALFLKPAYDYLRKHSIKAYSRFDNIYYCCTQKTASQWIRAVLDNSLTYHYTGLGTVRYDTLGLYEARITEPFPLRTIATTLYIDYPTYLAIPKPPSHQAFFVLRDPRDSVVSWYYSMKYSHRADVHPIILETRSKLLALEEQAGMRLVIDQFVDIGFFSTQRSWMGKDVRIFRYEDLAEDCVSFLRELFRHLEIHMPDNKIVDMSDTLSFRNRAGRSQGQENVHSHLRKGVAGDWKVHFDATTLDHFYTRTGDLVGYLGYLTD